MVVANTSASRAADRVHALGFDGGFVHEAVVEVADLALDAAGRGTLAGGFLDNFPDRQFRPVAQGGEGSLQRAVIRDGGALEPGPVHVLVQVILRPDAVVDI